MKLQELRQIIKEEIDKVITTNQPYEIISKKKTNHYGINKDNYSLLLNDETYKTPDGLTFKLKTIGNTSIPNNEELNLNNPTHFFYFIYTSIYDENNKELESIPGFVNNGLYHIKPSINKAKKWLDKKGNQLISGKGYQHKST